MCSEGIYRAESQWGATNRPLHRVPPSALAHLHHPLNLQQATTAPRAGQTCAHVLLCLGQQRQYVQRNETQCEFGSYSDCYMHAYEPPQSQGAYPHSVKFQWRKLLVWMLTCLCLHVHCIVYSLSLLIWGNNIICSSVVNSGTVYCVHRPSSPKVKCNKVLFLSYGKSTHYTPYWNATAINSILFCAKLFNVSPHRYIMDNTIHQYIGVVGDRGDNSVNYKINFQNWHSLVSLSPGRVTSAFAVA